MDALSNQLGPISSDAEGYADLRAFLEQFFGTYRRFGPILRAWLEGHVDDRQVNALGVTAFTDIATALGKRMREAGAKGDNASISALMALLERFAYFLVSRRPAIDEEPTLDTVTTLVHRGFFAAPVSLVGDSSWANRRRGLRCSPRRTSRRCR